MKDKENIETGGPKLSTSDPRELERIVFLIETSEKQDFNIGLWEVRSWEIRRWLTVKGREGREGEISSFVFKSEASRGKQKEGEENKRKPMKEN